MAKPLKIAERQQNTPENSDASTHPVVTQHFKMPGMVTVGVVLLLCTQLTWVRNSLSLTTFDGTGQVALDLLQVDVPYQPAPGQPGIDGQRHANVDLQISPGAPVHLLVTSLGLENEVASAVCRVERTTDKHKYLPRRIDLIDSPPRINFENSLLQHPTSSAVKDNVEEVVKQNIEQRANGNDSKTGMNLAPRQRNFWIHVTSEPLESASGYQMVIANQITGRTSVGGSTSEEAVPKVTPVEIFADQCLNADPAIQRQGREIAEMLEDEILPDLMRQFGPINHPSGDPGLTVLMTPWLSRLKGGTTQAKGFVRSTDFRIDLKPPFSNAGAILYLNSDLPQGSALKSLLIHEATHAALFSHLANQTTRPNQQGIDDWLNEGMAHLAEWKLGDNLSNLDFRIAQFYQRPEFAPLAVVDYYRANRWRDHGCRGAAFLYLRHLKLQSSDSANARLMDLMEQVHSRTSRSEFESNLRRWSIDLARTPWMARHPIQFGRCINSGPRFRIWNVEENAEFKVSVSGTASTFVELRSNTPALYRLRLPADDLNHRWQITLLKPAVGLPHVRLQADVRQSGASDKSLTDLRVALQGDLPANWKWDCLVSESTQGEKLAPQVWFLGGPPQSRPRSMECSQDGRSVFVTLPNSHLTSNLVLKARLIGPHGRTSWIWCDVSTGSSVDVALKPLPPTELSVVR